MPGETHAVKARLNLGRWAERDDQGMNPTVWAAIISVSGTVIVGVAGFITTTRVAQKAGETSAENTERTLSADREARLLERQVDLYAEILAFSIHRRLHRFDELSAIRVDPLQQVALALYKPPDWWPFLGRVEALANHEVLTAFKAAHMADQDAIQLHNARLAKTGTEADHADDAVLEAFTRAEEAEDKLTAAVRRALGVSAIDSATAEGGATVDG